MDLKNKIIFDNGEQVELGLGFHNIGSGVLRYSNEEIKKSVELYYSQRCGHIPQNAKTIGIIIEEPNDEIRSQIAYLSEIIGRKIEIFTPAEINKLKTKPLIVPYISVPEVEEQFSQFEARTWGLPGKLTHVLKNKSEFSRLAKFLHVEDFRVPEYTTTYLAEVIPHTKTFLKQIEEWYAEAGLKDSYPLGVMMRAADEDGNYGSSLLYEKGKYVVMVPNGEAMEARVYGNWEEALVNSKRILTAAMQTQKEPRVVISRYIDTLDSPGMSMVILEGKIFSLGWNTQTQKEPSRNPVAAGTYRPTNPVLRDVKEKYEEHTAKVLEKFLRGTAERSKIDFNKVNGIVNFDIIIPSELERSFQEKRGVKPGFYYSECNPRWTTYTDAVMTVLAAERKPQTVENMRKVIEDGIAVIDKYKLPKHVEPRLVRELVYKKDKELQKKGTRLICRMTTNPMGVIFAGDVELAQAEMRNIVKELAAQEVTSTSEYLFQ